MEGEFDEKLCLCIGNYIWQGKVEGILLADGKFVEDLDNFPGLLMGEKFKDKSIDEKKEFLHQCVIGNTSRTFILNVLALKHLSRILNSEAHGQLDNFWQSRLDKFTLFGRGDENKLFDKINLGQTIGLVETLLREDDDFINLFEKAFCKEGSLNRENIVKVVTSILTCSPTLEFAVTLFIFKYISNALENSKAEFIDDEEFVKMIEKISKIL